MLVSLWTFLIHHLSLSREGIIPSLELHRMIDWVRDWLRDTLMCGELRHRLDHCCLPRSEEHEYEWSLGSNWWRICIFISYKLTSGKVRGMKRWILYSDCPRGKMLRLVIRVSKKLISGAIPDPWFGSIRRCLFSSLSICIPECSFLPKRRIERIHQVAAWCWIGCQDEAAWLVSKLRGTM